VSLLLAAHRVPALAPVLAAVPDGVPIYAASQSVIDRIAGFPVHRGILALGRRGALQNAADLLSGVGEQALIVMLCGTANHDNLGGVFRNAAGFGVDAILLDAQCCDPLYRKAIRVSVGATLLVPWTRLSPADDPVALLAGYGFSVVATSPSGTLPLACYDRPPRVAALFGAEGSGLPDNLIARAQSVSIPMARGFDSLNLATTSGIVLHHLAYGASRR
ncbi:MAG: RNA methyltransferase, partial [Aliidongia sp.]